jgi:thymidylate synthase (FAD)
MDKYFRVELIKKTENPAQTIYAAMHQDYSSSFVADEQNKWPSESKCEQVIINRLLKYHHYGPLEHPAITFNVGFFPHSVMQQARTHRVGISFDVMSFRYSSSSIVKAAQGKISIEEAFYVRPVGDYCDRNGKKYFYSQEQRDRDLDFCKLAAIYYEIMLSEGISEEHARGIIPFDVRQHWIVSFNARSLMHFLDMRWKKDAQLEIQQLCNLIYPHFYDWMPEIAQYYKETRGGKNKIAP